MRVTRRPACARRSAAPNPRAPPPSTPTSTEGSELTSSPWLQPGDSRCSGGSTANLPLGWLTLHQAGRPRRERSYLASTSRRPEPQGQNSGGCVDVGVGLIPAGHTAEVGLALARLRCDVLAARIGLRRVRGGYGDDAAPVLSPMPLEGGAQSPPCLVQNRPIQACLLAHMPSGLLDRPLCRSGHVLD